MAANCNRKTRLAGIAPSCQNFFASSSIDSIRGKSRPGPWR
jgi:hypothetical protein